MRVLQDPTEAIFGTLVRRCSMVQQEPHEPLVVRPTLTFAALGSFDERGVMFCSCPVRIEVPKRAIWGVGPG